MDAVYADDVTKDITKLILAVEELSMLRKTSFVQALKSRKPLLDLYGVFSSLFASIPDYQIQIRDLRSVPPRFLLRTSKTVLAKVEGPIVVSGSAELWDLLPTIPNTFMTDDAPPAPISGKPAKHAAPRPQEVLKPNNDSDDDIERRPPRPHGVDPKVLALCVVVLGVTGALSWRLLKS